MEQSEVRVRVYMVLFSGRKVLAERSAVLLYDWHRSVAFTVFCLIFIFIFWLWVIIKQRILSLIPCSDDELNHGMDLLLQLKRADMERGGHSFCQTYRTAPSTRGQPTPASPPTLSPDRSTTRWNDDKTIYCLLKRAQWRQQHFSKKFRNFKLWNACSAQTSQTKKVRHSEKRCWALRFFSAACCCRCSRIENNWVKMLALRKKILCGHWPWMRHRCVQSVRESCVVLFLNIIYINFIKDKQTNLIE